MKLLHISDTHGFHEAFSMAKFDDIDIVIHSGDCSNYRDPYRNESEVRTFIAWYKAVPVKYKIYVAGNHDTSIERRMITKQDFTDAGIIYLENEEIVIEGIKFWGSPHTPQFGDWAFMKKRETINRVWDTIPEDVQVLIVHGPPKGIRDLSYDRHNNLEYCGCGALLKKCFKLPKLELVCFGHIHDMDDVYNQGVTIMHKIDARFSNAACVDDGKFDKGLTSYGNLFNINI